MELQLFKFRFSAPFNRLTYLGMWPADTLTSNMSKKLYYLSHLFFKSILILVITLELTDLYFSFGNLRKMNFNMCTSFLGTGYPIIIFLLYRRRDCIYELRMRLWRDSHKYISKEDVALQDSAHAKLKHLHQFFYLASIVCVTIMLVSGYFSFYWGVRELPFAGYVPIQDPSNDFVFVPALLFEGFCAFYVIFVVIESELCMFSLIFQISAFFNILIKNINKISEIYEDDEENEPVKVGMGRLGFKKDLNAYLKQQLAKRSLKESVIRYLELIDYVQKFEYIFSRCLFAHILLFSVITLANCVELTLYVNEFSVKLCFQIGFIGSVFLDTLLLCQNLSTVSSECEDVGNAVYSILWYKMDVKTRKEFCIMMIRARKPPKLTAGKLFVMDLNTFLHLLRNIYSWLMLTRQLMEK